MTPVSEVPNPAKLESTLFRDTKQYVYVGRWYKNAREWLQNSWSWVPLGERQGGDSQLFILIIMLHDLYNYFSCRSCTQIWFIYVQHFVYISCILSLRKAWRRILPLRPLLAEERDSLKQLHLFTAVLPLEAQFFLVSSSCRPSSQRQAANGGDRRSLSREGVLSLTGPANIAMG